MIEVLLVTIFLSLAFVPLTLVIYLIAYAATAATRTIGVCRRCSYDLRKLGDSRACPECGQPFEINARGDVIS